MVAPVRRAALAVLGQKRALLQTLSPGHYTTPCPLVGDATIGQHLRHSMDHYARCLAAATEAAAKTTTHTHTATPNTPTVTTTIHYDVRKRGTAVESDISEARKEVDRLIAVVESLPDAALARPVAAAFVLSSDDADGAGEPLASTVGRELGFVTHHAIHHHALIKTMAKALGLGGLGGIREFGVAPSTAQYRKATEA